jgi:hypothetical protein
MKCPFGNRIVISVARRDLFIQVVQLVQLKTTTLVLSCRVGFHTLELEVMSANVVCDER